MTHNFIKFPHFYLRLPVPAESVRVARSSPVRMAIPGSAAPNFPKQVLESGAGIRLSGSVFLQQKAEI